VAEIAVVRDSDREEVVELTTTDGTATAGEDYTAAREVVAFRAGEMRRTVVIPIRRDGLAEGEETVELTLSYPGAPTRGRPMSRS
jgi:hypothetical protein